MKLREATVDDARILLEWRNDPVTRAMSINPEPIAWETHIDWLSRRLSRAQPDIYICETDGLPFGTVRIDGDEISYAIGAGFRGKGLATQMLKLAAQRFGRKRARIKRGNDASARAAANAGHIVEFIED